MLDPGQSYRTICCLLDSFHPRCPFANDRCKAERPKALPIEGGTVACHAIEEGRLPIEDRTYAVGG